LLDVDVDGVLLPYGGPDETPAGGVRAGVRGRRHDTSARETSDMTKKRPGENAEPLTGELAEEWATSTAHLREASAALRRGDGQQAAEAFRTALEPRSLTTDDLAEVRDALHVPEDAGDLAPELEEILRRIPDGWGRWISLSRGWYPIVVALDRRLADLDNDYVLFQVKEKFGGLRYYFEPSESASPDTIAAMRAAVKEAESVAGRTCEECGVSGAVLRDDEHRYWQTLCDECATRP